MRDNPCDICREDCQGGIIYGNCPLFRTWFRAYKVRDAGVTSRLHTPQNAPFPDK